MRYLALATDYDETIAEHGTIRPSTIAALKALRGSGRKLLLVTGRELAELKAVCSRLDLFDLAVCENGAVLFDPASGTATLLARAEPPQLAMALADAGVRPLFPGEVMISTLADQMPLLRATLRKLDIQVEVILNKSSVMILPAGVNKGSGLKEALSRIGLSLPQTVAVGDAENDLAMFAASGCAVAVANAVPQLKAIAHMVTAGEAGDGVAELIALMLKDDLSGVQPLSIRRAEIGTP